MINKNPLIVFVVSLMIAGLFLLSTPQEALSGSVPGPPPCCRSAEDSCVSGISQEECQETFQGDYFPDRACVGERGGSASCVAPIPTLNEWGKIIIIAVIGLFAVIGLIVTRRVGVFKDGS